VDALGKREGKRAAHELHHLLDQGENPLGLLAMIVRQYRLLILVKELQAQNGAEKRRSFESGNHLRDRVVVNWWPATQANDRPHRV
jgi:DNA polymerase III delta subunit